MSERLEAFEAEIEVITHDGYVVAVTYDGRCLQFDSDEVAAAKAADYRDVYENGDAAEVLAVEVPDDES